MKFFKTTLWLTFLATTMTTQASTISQNLEREYLRKGGPKKALDHMRCILDNWSNKNIRLKISNPSDRCREPNNSVAISSRNYAVIVDYTTPSSNRRLFVLDLTSTTGKVDALYVSHGKNGNTDKFNTVPGPGKNTVLMAEYFSNTPNSAASATGLYVTGKPYVGQYNGDDPSAPKKSLIIHGVEKGSNENSCRRDIVLHGMKGVHESGPQKGMHIMSAGCFMVDFSVVNELIEGIRNSQGLGTALLAYGPRESQLSSRYYCGTNL